MTIYYLQTKNNNYVTDAVDYPHGSYKAYEAEYLPDTILAGCWQLIDGVLVEDVEKNPTTIQNIIQNAIDDYTLTLLEGGFL